MGAKGPDKLKLRRPTYKCNVCGRKCLNMQALTMHQNSAHKMNTTAKAASHKRSPSLQAAKVVKKKVSSAPVAKKPANMPPSMVATKSGKKASEEISEEKQVNSAKKIQFKCPKCVRVFNVYFSAYRHIQKYHCVDKNDKPVEPNSSDLIKPIHLERCTLCYKTFGTDKRHICEPNDLLNLQSDRYMCLGCQKTFENLMLYEQHVKGLHTKELDALYFPSKAEFTSWKTELENVTKIKYIMLSTSKQKSKQIYHCSHEPSIEMDKILMCPSSLSVTEFKDGYHVIQYKEHFGHTCSDVLPLKYKKYSISPLIKDTDSQNVDLGNEYQQFKCIMNDVIERASKVDLSDLYVLLEKAFEMSVVLNTTIQEDEHSITNKTMTDEQITEVLSEVKTYPGKRKADTAIKDTKKKPTLENNDKLDKPGSKAVESLPSPRVKALNLQSPSFNDTYKDFVDQNFKNSLDPNTPKRGSVKKKVVMKTKIGQFKAKESVSPQAPVKVDSPSQSKAKSNMTSPIPTLPPKMHIEYKIKADFKYEVKEQENDCNILILKI